MKKSTIEFLDACLNEYVYSGFDSIFSFYKLYSGCEIESIFDIKKSVNEFCEYLKRNVSRIKRIEKFNNDAVILKTIDSFERSINVSIERYLDNKYKKFSDMICELAPNGSNEKILEVGAGRIPSSSIWMKEKVDKVLTIDTQFYLSKNALMNMGVNSEEMTFNVDSNIDGATFVVGRCPCSAIKHMIRKCAEQNLPYLIKLCDCDIVLARKYMAGLKSWENILPEYDQRAKIYKGFAYNLDVSKELLEKLIEKYDTPAPPRARRVAGVVLNYNNGVLVNEEEIIL